MHFVDRLQQSGADLRVQSEAAVHRVPVIFGPDMHSQRELDRLFKEADAGLQVAPERLAPTLLELLRDPSLRREQGERAWGVLEENRGSAARAVAAVRRWLDEDLSGR